MLERLGEFNQQQLQNDAELYATFLSAFIGTYKLDSLFSGKPVDHIAVKAAGLDDFERYLESITPFANLVVRSEVNSRWLVTARLIKAVNLGTYGPVSYVELMQPKPGSNPNGLVGLDHVEFVNPNFNQIDARLWQVKAGKKLQSNSNHSAIVVVINSKGQEVKFTNTTLLEINQKEVKEGRAEVLKGNL